MSDSHWRDPLERERPVIDRVLAAAPSRRVLDLGCGTGERARFLAELGCEVVAIDASEDALDRAQQESVPESVQFLLTDMGAVEGAVRGHFGAAFCVGNTLPHLLTPESASRMLVGLKRRLLPGAPLLLQLANYERVFAGDLRALPVATRPSPEGEEVVVELLKPRADGIVVHTTSTLLHRPIGQPVMEVVEGRRMQLRGWLRAEVEAMLEATRLSPREVFGDMTGRPYEAEESAELVVIAS